MSRKNMSVARIEKLSTAKIGKAERHNERKNESYGNLNVVPERIPFNISVIKLFTKADLGATVATLSDDVTIDPAQFSVDVSGLALAVDGTGLVIATRATAMNLAPHDETTNPTGIDAAHWQGNEYADGVYTKTGEGWTWYLNMRAQGMSLPIR